MTRDQKPRLQTKKPKSASRGSTLVGIFVGLILGALVAAGIALYFTSSSPFPKSRPDDKPDYQQALALLARLQPASAARRASRARSAPWSWERPIAAAYRGGAEQKIRYAAKSLGDALKTGQTQILIETPYRNAALLQALLQTLHPHTRLAVSGGLTLSQQFTRSALVAAAYYHAPSHALDLLASAMD